MPELADDMLEGAADIAAFLGGKWTVRRVYHARERKLIPLHSRPGVKLYAFKTELEAYFRGQESNAPHSPAGL